MTAREIRRALRQAARVCFEKERICWGAIDVVLADGAYEAASELADSSFTDTPAHAATFLLLCAEAI
jgi:hypothetical protein